MDEGLRYHQELIERFTRRGDWSNLVRHFMRHQGYQPAMDAAIGILEARVGSSGLLGDQVLPVLDLLKDWQDPARWQGFGMGPATLRSSSKQTTLVLLDLYRKAASIRGMIGRLGDEEVARDLRMLLDGLGSGVAIARKEKELAVAAALSDAAAGGLSALGCQEEAVERGREAVTACRKLVMRNRAVYLSSLAAYLNNLAAILSELGRNNLAVRRAREAVMAYRELTVRNRAGFLANFAASVENLALLLIELGRREEAVERVQEAVVAYQELAGNNRAAFLPNLATCLTTLALLLCESRRREDALQLAEDAVKAFREVEGTDRSKFLPSVPVSLDLLALGGSVLLKDPALEHSQEPVSSYRELAVKNRAAFLPNMAASLNTLALVFSELGRHEDAVARADEAVTAYRELAAKDRAAILPDLAMSLKNLVTMLTELGRREDALERAEEVVSAYWELSVADRMAFLPRLAASLNTSANLQSELGRRGEASDRAEQAVSAYEELALKDRAAFLPDLAMSLNNLAVLLDGLGRREEALKRAHEAVSAYGELAEKSGVAYLPDLLMSLDILSLILGGLGRREEALMKAEKALEQAERAVNTYRELAGKNRAAFLPNLANSLHTLAPLLGWLGRGADGLDRAREAVTVYRELAGKNRVAFLPNLAASLETLANRLCELDRRQEALERAEEAVEIHCELPEATRRALSNGRALACATLGRIYLTPDPSGARDLTRALDALRQSIQCIEEHRGSFRADAQRRRVLSEAIASYELLIQTAVDLWDTRRDVKPLRDALLAAEGIRQRLLLERLRDEFLEPDAPKDVRREWRRSFMELQAADIALETLALGSIDGNQLGSQSGQSSRVADDRWSARRKARAEADLQANRAKLGERREEAARQHDRALKAVHATHPGFDPHHPVPRADHEDARRLLEAIPGTVLVEYVVCHSVGYALLVWGEQLHAICLPELSVRGARTLALRWMKGYPKRASNQEKTVAALIRWGDELEAKLLEFAPKVLWPVLRALKEFEKLHRFKAKRLVLCPHQFLNLLPIHAMPLERPGDNLLVDRYEVSYAPSLSVLKRCAARQPGTGRRVLFGNPTNDLRFIGAATEAYRREHPEAEVIHGRAASVEKLIQSGMGMGWGEIWAHMIASDDPMEAGIVLRDGELLRLERIYRELRLRLKPHLTLNGCESGLLKPVRGRKTAGNIDELAAEDLVDFDGLPMGFLFAGARSVVSTLWKVFDVSAALLMDRYHAELAKGGSTPAGALRMASQWLRKKIRNGTELKAAGEALLRRVPEEWARTHADDLEDCRSMLDQLAAEHPDDPPFASPIHWASHFVTGWCWDPVDFTEKR